MENRNIKLWITIICIIIVGEPVHLEAVSEGCKPFAVRLNLGRYYAKKTENEKLGIIFDTHNQCSQSYAIFQTLNVTSRIPCSTERVAWSDYQTFVHRCSIIKLDLGSNFSYMVFGWPGPTEAPSPYENVMIRSHLPDEHGQNKFVVIADWGFLRVKAGIYDPLDKAFDQILNSNEKIDGIYIGGDIAYDLSSVVDNNYYYEDFVKMLSQVASRWPLLLNIGNHEHTLQTDYMILNKSFQVYGSVSTRITVLNLPHINWIMFDPYLIVFKGEDPTQLAGRMNTTLKMLRETDPNTPVIVSSHYPFHCNGNIPDCRDCRMKLISFFRLMIEYNVALYIGAHYHTYQRDYPFYQNQSHVQQKSPYTWTPGGNPNPTKNTLLSIVEGIAGNDREIIMEYPPDEPFTAAYSIGVTGFGKMGVDWNKLEYVHVWSTSPTVERDSWMLKFNKSKDEVGGNEENEDERTGEGHIRISEE